MLLPWPLSGCVWGLHEEVGKNTQKAAVRLGASSFVHKCIDLYCCGTFGPAGVVHALLGGVQEYLIVDSRP